MELRRALTCVVLACSCGLDETGLGLVQDGGSIPDVSIDAPDEQDAAPESAPPDDAADEQQPDASQPCNPSSPFGGFVAVGGGVDTNGAELGPFLTRDELTIFFSRDVGGGRLALLYATRPSTGQAFGAATKITAISTNSTSDAYPYMDDSLTHLYFSSIRNGTNSYHLYQAVGNGTPNGWSQITSLDVLNAKDPLNDLELSQVSVTSELWFTSNRLGSYDLFISPDAKTAPTVVSTLATAASEAHPVISSDALTLFFSRADNSNNFHVMTSTRTTTSGSFANPTNEAEFESGQSSNSPGWLSPDGCRMYFMSNRSGNQDIWFAARGP